MPLQYRDVEGVAGGQTNRMLKNLASAQDVTLFDGQDVVDDLQHSLQCWLDRIETLERSVAVQDFLQHLGVGNQSLI